MASGMRTTVSSDNGGLGLPQAAPAEGRPEGAAALLPLKGASRKDC